MSHFLLPRALSNSVMEDITEPITSLDGTFQTTADGKVKGIYLQFYTDTVVYEYAPFQCTEEEYITWERKMMDARSWIKTSYWKLEDVSCVLILRQPEWFALMLDKFTATNLNTISE